MKTPVIQCSPCYSAVSSLLTNPLPDRSNYSPLLPHPLPHSGSISLSQEFRRNVVPWGSWTTSRGKCRFLILLFKLLTLSLFSLSLSPLCSLSQSSLYSLSTIPSFSSDQFIVFLRKRLQISLHSVPMAHIFAFCFTPWHIFLIMHFISL